MVDFAAMTRRIEARQKRDGGTFLEAIESLNRDDERGADTFTPSEPHDEIPTSMSFDVQRGYFQVDAATARDEERLAYAIASQTPEGAKLTSEPIPGGGRRFTWRIIRIVPHWEHER